MATYTTKPIGEFAWNVFEDGTDIATITNYGGWMVSLDGPDGPCSLVATDFNDALSAVIQTRKQMGAA